MQLFSKSNYPSSLAMVINSGKECGEGEQKTSTNLDNIILLGSTSYGNAQDGSISTRWFSILKILFLEIPIFQLGFCSVKILHLEDCKLSPVIDSATFASKGKKHLKL